MPGIRLLLALSLLTVACAPAMRRNAPPAPPVENSYEAAAQYSRERNGSALLVYRGGELVHHEGQNGFDPAQPHRLASGTKSFGCAVAVRMQQQGLLNLDERAADTLTEWQADPARRDVTVRQLLNFTSGLPSDMGEGNFRQRDMYRETVDAKLVAAPGEVYTYGAAHLAAFSELVRRKTGRDVAAYLHDEILDPIGAGISLFIRDARGLPALGGGAVMRAEDWARYGQLLLNDGQYGGRTVLDAVKLRECFKGSAALSAYGLTFWLNAPLAGTLGPRDIVPPVITDGVPPGAPSFFPDAPANVLVAAGAGNQRLYVLPDQDMVVVRFGEGGPWSDTEFLKLLLAGE